jgi:asparagine synthase (glutamine-hydrolysing)
MSLVSYAEARTYMHDVLLRDTDQMSMRHGLEVRVPFLDHELAAYVVGLPARAKSGSGSKPLLASLLRSHVPDTVIDRPKQGFVLPFAIWMRGDLRALCERHLGPKGLAGRPEFRPEALASLWTTFLAGGRGTSWSRPWTLVALNAWLEQTGVHA